ncbi:MAG: dihydroneopterin aldolase [Bacteroidia bacterium]|nr:MAG: dihydroneopterin aldolase [Bacteroidia bacterium]
MGRIEIEEMEFFAYHGCYAEEQIVGNKFIVSLMLEVDCEKAAMTDDINDAVNYQKAYELVKAEVEKKSHLLEHLAKRILDSLYKHLPGIIKARVKVSKMNPPMGGKIGKVSLTLSR